MVEEGVQKIVFSISRKFLIFCLCFILGVGSFSFTELGSGRLFYVYLSLFAISFFLIIFWHKVYLRFFCFCFLFFLAGGARFLLEIPADTSGSISHYNGERILFLATVNSHEESDGSNEQYVVAAEGVVVGNNTKSVHGKVLLETPAYSEFIYGDRLEITCLLAAPKVSLDSNFRYDRYLARRGIWSICQGAAITSLSTESSHIRGNFPIFYSIIRSFIGFRNRIDEQVKRLWPEPESGLVSGILYGARSGLPDDLLDDFSRVGITHIIAISGYNISIISVVFLNLLTRIGFSRGRSFWLVVSIIILFILFAGASASVVRAGIMGIVVLLAEHLGRLSRMANILAFTAALMLLFNPFVLIWDAGFQLSFLATLGLVYILPLLKRCPEIFQATLAAIIATLPLILFQFGRLSAVAPLVNVLVLWVIPYLMLLGFLAVFCSFVFYPLGQVLAWVGVVGMKYLIFISQWFAKFSWSAINISIPWWLMMCMYLFLVRAVINFRRGGVVV